MIKSNKINDVDFDNCTLPIYCCTESNEKRFKKSKNNHRFDVKRMGKSIFHH